MNNLMLEAECRSIANRERLETCRLQHLFANGEVVVLGAGSRSEPVAVGSGVSAKISANVGTSPMQQDHALEFSKAKSAISAGADMVMDLSICGDIDGFQARICGELDAPVCSNPVYQAAADCGFSRTSLSPLPMKNIVAAIEKQAERGVDSLTLHCALTREILDLLGNSKRLIQVTARGGSIVAASMMKDGGENPLYERFDEVLAILKNCGTCLSVGNSTRSGTVVDRPGEVQFKELEVMGELVARARSFGVQVRVEAPIGHVGLDDLPAFVAKAKRICRDAPIGALGPLPTDVGLSYDDVSSAIGCAVAVAHGLDFVSAISRREHIGIPSLEDTRDAVVAARIATHAGDLMRLGRRTETWDREMSSARSNLCWEKEIEASVNPKRAKQLFEERNNTCSLCGQYCPLRITIPEMDRAEGQ